MSSFKKLRPISKHPKYPATTAPSPRPPTPIWQTSSICIRPAKAPIDLACAANLELTHAGNTIQKKLLWVFHGQLKPSRWEPEGEEEHSFTRDGWQYDEANCTRELSWLHGVLVQITTALHRGWEFWVGEIAYVLHLSVRQVLDDIDTEIIVLPAYYEKHIGMFEGPEESESPKQMSRWYVIVGVSVLWTRAGPNPVS
ncbi:hypothetical protein N7494_006259 [Penicillium frequentans]|uniref:Uncharacterized protein n=1 Tax=Penicillium frequentans TaxID=3151616 RepID=A0AAD6CYB9_9EURO|nr:hypothetical protein N7494_006259 [Penicillium glabrum]